MKRIFITLLGIIILFSCETLLTQKEEKQEKDTITQSKVVKKDTHQNHLEKDEKQEKIVEANTNTKCTIVAEMPKNLEVTLLMRETSRVEAITFQRKRGIKRAIEINEGDSYTQIKNNKIVLDSITKRIDLNKEQIQKLFDVLFKYKGENSERMACYDPQDVLVFYKQDKAIAFLEICFGCKGTRSYGVSFTDFCDEKWEKLGEFF